MIKFQTGSYQILRTREHPGNLTKRVYIIKTSSFYITTRTNSTPATTKTTSTVEPKPAYTKRLKIH